MTPTPPTKQQQQNKKQKTNKKRRGSHISEVGKKWRYFFTDEIFVVVVVVARLWWSHTFVLWAFFFLFWLHRWCLTESPCHSCLCYFVHIFLLIVTHIKTRVLIRRAYDERIFDGVRGKCHHQTHVCLYHSHKNNSTAIHRAIACPWTGKKCPTELNCFRFAPMENVTGMFASRSRKTSLVCSRHAH